MRGVLAAIALPPSWETHRLDGIFRRRKVTGVGELESLSVFTELGVVPRSSQEWSYKALGESLDDYLLVEPGDLVFNKLRTWQGAIGLSRYRGIVSPAYFVCRARREIDARYFHHLLRSLPWIQELKRISKWMPPNQNDIAWDELKSMEVPVPSLHEQRAIGDYLDRKTAGIDALIAAKRGMVELLDERDRLAFERVAAAYGFFFPRDLAPDWRTASVPADWNIMRLSQVLSQLTNGYVGPTRDILVESGVPYIQSLHIKNGRIDFSRRAFFVEKTWHDERPRIHLREGDVLIVQTGDIGQVAVVPPDFGPASCHALQIARVNRKLITGQYLCSYLRSWFGFNSLLSRATGALHPHLEAGIKDIPVVVPPFPVQTRVVAQVDRANEEMARMKSMLQAQTDLLLERRQALITAAVTGQLDIPDAA
jgi:type I restriction enzyme S subunit